MERSAQDSSSIDQPVTYVIRRRVKAGSQSEFDDWLKGINEAVRDFRGHLGADVIRPVDPSCDDYVIIWRFDSYANLKQWEDSQVRKDWLDRSWHLSVGTPDIQKLTGLEFWFSLPGDPTKAPPPKRKMALVVILALYPLLMVLHLLLNPVFVLFPLPYPAQLLVTVIIAVLIMTFFLMPFMTRLFSRWLYG